MTLRSRHFCGVVEDQVSVTLNRAHRTSRSLPQDALEAAAAKPGLSVTHVFLDVDVSHAFAVEFLLHAGDGSIVSRNPVDSSVLQTSLLHNLTAHLHDERNKLQQEDRG